jgi:hypothetical protein
LFSHSAPFRLRVLPVPLVACTDDEFSRTAGLLRSWGLNWAISCPLPAGAEVFIALLKGSPGPGQAVVRP